MKKIILITIGILSLLLGGIGVFLPVLPTTPFLLLSAYCFSKSSEKFHSWLLENRIFGKYIRDYQEKKGITLKNKIIAVVTILISIGFSLSKVSNIHIKIILVLVLIVVTTHIIRLRTLEK